MTFNTSSDPNPTRPLHSPADTISIADILDGYETYGIPHFQRGSVWGPANVSALLESLYYDTPCGSIILWTPADMDCHGIPLVKGGRIRHLIIDGQQRTRSVHAAFKGLFEHTEEAADEAEDGDRAKRHWTQATTQSATGR